jgi:hypothetical protein
LVLFISGLYAATVRIVHGGEPALRAGCLACRSELDEGSSHDAAGGVRKAFFECSRTF